MPRAMQDTLGVQASLLNVEESRVVSSDLPALVPEHGLITLVEGPEERFGIAVLDSTTLAGLIEATTTGRIASRQVVPRAPTRTDAIIAADLLDALLDGFEAGLAEMEDPPNIAGYRYAAPLIDTRAMDLALAEGPYSVFRLTLDLGGGVRQGELVIAFPVAARGLQRGADAASFQKALADNVMRAPTELAANLFRLQLPLSEVRALGTGDVVRIPLSALAEVAVEAGGRPVATARLGQQGGFRAVRIAALAGSGDEPSEDDFQDAAPTAALPPADAGFEADAEGGFAGLGELPPLEDFPGLGDLSEAGEGGLPDLTPLGEAIELPPLDGDGPEDDGPALPPLSG